jgi:nicotinamidase-related amidase
MKRALLVIDAQKIYTNPESVLFCVDSTATIKRINKLIERFQSAGDPIVFIRHIHKTDASDLGRMFDYLGDWDGSFNFKEGTSEVEFDDRLSRLKGSIEITKNRYSSFVNTTLHDELRKRGINCVVISGFMTNFCCDATARSAHDLDYYVNFIVDATGTPGTENMDEEAVRSAEKDFMESGIARVLLTDEFLVSTEGQAKVTK